MRPGVTNSPSLAWATGSGPTRFRISGRSPGLWGKMWMTTKTAAGRSAGSPLAMADTPSNAPAEPPTTLMS